MLLRVLVSKRRIDTMVENQETLKWHVSATGWNRRREHIGVSCIQSPGSDLRIKSRGNFGSTTGPHQECVGTVSRGWTRRVSWLLRGFRCSREMIPLQFLDVRKSRRERYLKWRHVKAVQEWERKETHQTHDRDAINALTYRICSPTDFQRQRRLAAWSIEHWLLRACEAGRGSLRYTMQCKGVSKWFHSRDSVSAGSVERKQKRETKTLKPRYKKQPYLPLQYS